MAGDRRQATSDGSGAPGLGDGSGAPELDRVCRRTGYITAGRAMPIRSRNDSPAFVRGEDPLDIPHLPQRGEVDARRQATPL
jgi:hypothetical protein